MIVTSKRMFGVKGQPMFALLSKAREMERSGRDMVHFELGDTDFNTPPDVKNVARLAIKNNMTHYASPSGIYPLKSAAREVTFRSRGFYPDLDQLLVTPGANMQIYLALAVTCDQGDTVAIPRPYFPSYVSQAKSLGLKVRFYSSINDLLEFNNIKAIIINSPNNPTGNVLSKSEIRAAYLHSMKTRSVLISDEVYSRMIYRGEFFSPSEYDQCKYNVIIVNGFSKSFAMSGWRLGVMTGPLNIIEKCTILLETILSCVPPFIQMAGASALLGMQKERKGMIRDLTERRKIMCDGLNSIAGVSCEEPAGGLYCWANIKKTGLTSTKFADMAMDFGVVLSPGIFFGRENYVRLCYGGSVENIHNGIERLRKIR